ncbi:MAG: acetyl-CoA carboxylase carboxyltransferase subunit beta [Alphaproteobacteria bacterium]|nr:acetyl-CoA carboxylase carboxyltransferase subunit beta [Alphaproteobacteria bacterium]
MNWLKKVRPKLSTIFRRERPASEEAKWDTCVNCGQMVYHKEMVAAQYVCPHCGHHHKMPPGDRFAALFDAGSHDMIEVAKGADDPLKFRDKKKYADRIKASRTETGQQDAILVALGKIGGVAAVVGVQNFAFMGGSLGVGAGDAFVAGALRAVKEKAAFVMVTSSGGARMQEGILSLMQMPRTTVAIQMLREARLPYVVVLTDPTTGGVTASYAMLGDIQISEPGALIGFAGPRVIESTIREQLPQGFQRAEYLLDHGMIDMVVHRHELAGRLAGLLQLLMGGKRQEKPLALAPPAKGRRGAASG